MLNWVKKKFEKAAIEKQFGDTLKRDIDTINEAGGSDLFCKKVVTYYSSDDDDRKARLFTGTIADQKYIVPRSMLSVAAINSLMKVRKEIEQGHDDKALDTRLFYAEIAFIISWLLIEQHQLSHISDEERSDGVARSIDVFLRTQDKELSLKEMPQYQVAVEQLRKGNEALQNWKAADPMNFTFLTNI